MIRTLPPSAAGRANGVARPGGAGSNRAVKPLPIRVPTNLRRFRTLEMHTAGEPLRIICTGFPELLGTSVLDQRRDAMDNWDHLRVALMAEPRGHADMYGALLIDPASDDGHFGVLFLHNDGWSTMCGHGIIALATAAIEQGWAEPADADGEGGVEVRFDTPAGRVVARVQHESSGRASSVTFRNVPSFAVALDQELHAPALAPQPIAYDVAFGGAFYAYMPARALGLSLDRARGAEIVEAGRRAKRALVEAGQESALRHPLAASDPSHRDLEFLYGVIFTDGDRQACVFADGELDRSPTGTGVAGRAALWAARGERVDAFRELRSVVDSAFEVREVDRVHLPGGIDAIIPEVRGRAATIGCSEFWLDPEDPLGAGFFVGRGRDAVASG